MNAGFHHRAVSIGNDVERLRILRRNHFRDRFQAMLLVAGVDALRRIAYVEIGANLEPRALLQDRRALLFDRAGIDGRFIDDDIALLERGTH